MLLGGVFHKCLFYKKNSFCERIKLRPVSSVKNTPFTFFAFFSPCLSIFLKKISSPDFWGVKEAPCKNLYVFGENSQRNQFPKLTTFLLHFSLMSPLCHSALLSWLFKIKLNSNAVGSQISKALRSKSFKESSSLQCIKIACAMIQVCVLW